MRILINGRVCDRWGRKEDSHVRFSKHIGPSEGHVLSAEEAKAAAERATTGEREKLVLWSAAIFLVVIAMPAFIGVGHYRVWPALKFLVAALFTALFVGVNLWRIAAMGEGRRARLSRGELLPSAGASVTFDEIALTLDNAVIPWASLTVERLIVIETGGHSTNYQSSASRRPTETGRSCSSSISIRTVMPSSGWLTSSSYANACRFRHVDRYGNATSTLRSMIDLHLASAASAERQQALVDS